MNFAEGKGPKQVKANFYPLGQFKTVYGNDGTPGTVNPASPPYTAVVGAATVSGTPWQGGLVGSLIPGLNVNVNGNGLTDVGFVCSPGSSESVQDTESIAVTLTTETNFTGSGIVTLQGAANRYNNNNVFGSGTIGWNNIASTVVSGTNLTFTIAPTPPVAIYNAYRVIVSGYTSCSGIIDWSIAGLFVDISAMGVGNNAADANGNIGQMSIQGPRYLTISGGAVTSVTNGTPPYSSINNNRDFIGN